MSKTLLMEIGTEEIPAKFMPEALEQIKKIGAQKLKDYRINFENIKSMGTPRRITLIAENVNDKQDELDKLVKGPAKKIAYNDKGEFTPAALGFMKSQGVSEQDIRIDKVGNVEYIFAQKHEAGSDTKALLKEILPEIIYSMNFPKSMRWRDYNIRFARPIRWIAAMFGEETIEFGIEGVNSSNITRGHRTLSNYDITIKSADEYIESLKKEFIIVDPEERKSIIVEQINELAEGKKGKVLIDDELLEEVIFLVEYPTALIGSFETEFLELIKEAVITPMKEHQRYFPVLDEKGGLMPYFITVRNGGSESIDIVKHGNERVLRARLKDAQFFYNEDMKEKFESRIEKLKKVVYQEKLGTIYEKVERITRIAEFIGKKMGLSEEKMKLLLRAALLCKADLETAMVNEFDELQGVMGREYALKNGENPEVAEALYTHYLPRFSGDELPRDVLGKILSISDKLDSIAGSFGIGVQPSGSQDPYGLRRQALGVINILLDSDLKLRLDELINYSIAVLEGKTTQDQKKLKDELISFFKQRIRVIFVDMGYKNDNIDAVLEAGLGDIKVSKEKIEKLAKVRAADPENIEQLLAALNRVFNLAAKAEGISAAVNESMFENDYERVLYNTIKTTTNSIEQNEAINAYEDSIECMYELIKPINDFFENTMVIVENQDVKNNRLALLKMVKDVSMQICDFSKIM